MTANWHTHYNLTYKQIALKHEAKQQQNYKNREQDSKKQKNKIKKAIKHDLEKKRLNYT